MLSQLHGSGQAVVKIVTLAITGVMAALTAALMGITCYNRWQIKAYHGYTAHVDLSKIDDESKLAAAYWILYLLSVLAGSAISVALLLQIRSKRIDINVSNHSDRNNNQN
jgi:TRAP-type C4-dicarboxylate transport system permease small subunit